MNTSSVSTAKWTRALALNRNNGKRGSRSYLHCLAEQDDHQRATAALARN